MNSTDITAAAHSRDFARAIVASRHAEGTETQVDAQLMQWQERDKAVALVLQMAPAPTLLCPTWCTREAGHGWEDYDDGRLTRWHERDLSPTDFDAVKLYRIDELLLDEGGVENVSSASRLHLEAGGNGDGSASLKVDEAQTVIDAMQEAQRLLVASVLSGDPRMGRADLEWEQQQAAQE